MSFKLGNQGEQFVQNLMHFAGIECSSNDDFEKRYDYDLLCKIGRTKFNIEVKYDYMAERTGNLAIELHNTKKDEPSGLTVTKAEIWCVVIKDGSNLTAWIANVSKLRNFIDITKPKRIVENAGDDNAYLLLYADTIILDSVFTRIDDLDKDELKKVVRKVLKEK